MLQIAIEETEDHVEMVLAGRITGQWVTELSRNWAILAQRIGRRKLSLDLRQTTHVDDRGKQVLKYIYAQTNARILTRSLWTEYLAVEIMNSIDHQPMAAFLVTAKSEIHVDLKEHIMAFQDINGAGNHECLTDAVNISETLSYLTYLLCIDAENPERVRMYAQQAEERVRALGSLLLSMGCEGYFDLAH